MNDVQLQFWIGAAALTVITLLWLLRPLWRPAPADTGVSEAERARLNRRAFDERQQEIAQLHADQRIDDTQRAQLEAENARRFLAESQTLEERAAQRRSPVLLWVLLLLLPVVATGVYFRVGAWPAVSDWLTRTAPGQEKIEESQSMQELLLVLRTRLHRDPDDVDGWYMLGRSYINLGQPDQALQAFHRARELAPMEADYLVASAQALRLMQGESQDAGGNAEVDRFLRQALLLNPDHEGARLLTAYRDFESGRYAQAISHWQALKSARGVDSEAIAYLDQAIAKAQAAQMANGDHTSQKAPATTDNAVPAPAATAATVTTPATTTLAATTPATAAPAAGDTQAANAAVQVTVSLGNAVKLPEQGRVFVLARAAAGGPPVAVVARDLPVQWPLTVTLDDTQAMTPAARLSAQDKVNIVVRVSASGNAKAQSGDWQVGRDNIDWRQQRALQLKLEQQLP